MNIPNKLYISREDNDLLCVENPIGDSEEFIKKSHLIKWLEGKHLEISVKLTAQDDPVHWGQRNAFQQVIDELNRM